MIGSGIMGERLAGGNDAIALLGNTLPTGAILVVLITMLGPISGAHFNPAVTGVFWLKKEIDPSSCDSRMCWRNSLAALPEFSPRTSCLICPFCSYPRK